MTFDDDDEVKAFAVAEPREWSELQESLRQAEPEMIAYYIGNFKPMYKLVLSSPHARAWLGELKALAEASKPS